MLKPLFAGAPERTAKILLTAILAGAFGMMAWSAYRESATFDESAHIPAGYAYVRYLDYRLNPEHPPLLKAIAAFPLLFLNLNFPTHLDAWQKDVNGQWVMGGTFFYESGNDGDLIVRAARIGPIALTILLAFLIYAWARRMMGAWWAFVPTFLFAWSPNVLAHGHYVTTDIAAAFGIVLATYRFIRFLFEPSRKNLFLAGAAFGAAQLLKFSAVLLIPYLFALTAAFYLLRIMQDWRSTEAGARFKRFGIRAFRYLRAMFVVFVIGYALVVYPVYALFTARYPGERQARDAEAILSSFEGGATPAGARCAPMRCLADLTIKASRSRITQPAAEYALGVLTAFQRSQGGNANYFLGKVSGGGTPVYFPVIYLLKEPLPTLLIILAALAFGIRYGARTVRRMRVREWLPAIGAHEQPFTVLAMLAFIALYWFSSITSPLNIGLRHLFPVLPFTYILAALAWRRAVNGPSPEAASPLEAAFVKIRTLARGAIKMTILLVLLAWFAVETLAAAPHFLSYFNQLGGGTAQGYRYATDSNYDWGQDLLYLKAFMDAHPEIETIAVDYFGGGSPRYALGARAENWWSARGNPKDAGIGWLAVSANTLQGAIQPTKGFYERNPQDEYRWLTDLRPPEPGLGNIPAPDFRAGTSILIYRLR